MQCILYWRGTDSQIKKRRKRKIKIDFHFQVTKEYRQADVIQLQNNKKNNSEHIEKFWDHHISAELRTPRSHCHSFGRIIRQ